MGFGEICVKQPSCGCFSLKASSFLRDGTLTIRIVDNEEQLQCTENICQVWLERKAVLSERGHLKFTFSFQKQLHTTTLNIRLLKIIAVHDRQPLSSDSIECRIYVSQRDFRTLKEINNIFISKVKRLLDDVAQHQAFAQSPDLIRLRLESCSTAIYPDAYGFVLFKQEEEVSRPQHVLLRIRPTTIELCIPPCRSFRQTFSSERRPVASLQEALTEFSQSSNWPVVRRGQFGISWPCNHHSIPQPRLGISARVEDQWEVDEVTSRDVVKPFLDDTVQNFDVINNTGKNNSGKNSRQWNVDSVKSLVLQAAHVSFHENVSKYLAIEKATLAILSQCAPPIEAFVDSVACIIKTQGSESLGVYKLLSSTLDLPALKKAIMKMDLLTMLQKQYEHMTQTFSHSTTSEGSDSQCSSAERHLEVNKMQCFTCPANTNNCDVGPSELTEKRPPVAESSRRRSINGQELLCPVSRSCSEKTTRSLFSAERVDASRTPKGNLSTEGPSSRKDHRQEVPRLTFYWLSQHDGVRSLQSEATQTTISLPDGRSIIVDDDLRSVEMTQVLSRGLQLDRDFSPTRSISSDKTVMSMPDTVIGNTLLNWGVRWNDDYLDDPAISVAFAIKCTILEIMCAFSALNLCHEIKEECATTRDYKMLNEAVFEEEDYSPAAISVDELLAPRWQVFPGEQPSLRWGPSERGTHVALAVVHEFACRPLNEKESPDRSLTNMRLFLPQDLYTENYLRLLAGAKSRLGEVLQAGHTDDCLLEEAAAVMLLLGDFVASSPSFAPAQLVAYCCSDVFKPLETTVFRARSVSQWSLTTFRLFHSLLRLFRCMLEKASDVVLEEFLIENLLKKEAWVKLVRDYASAVLFSEKLARKCNPDERLCFQSGVWSYHTMLIKVVSAQRDTEEQDSESLPQDFRDSRPAVFGHDPLDFLHFLVAPGEGFAPRALKRRESEHVSSQLFSLGGLRAEVLFFLRTFFSVPSNGFIKHRDITAYYLELHWTGFKQSYRAASRGMPCNAAIVCKRHLEVIRVIMGHHRVEIFSELLRLGIIDALTDEIALETSLTTGLGSFNPPRSHLNEGERDTTSPFLDRRASSKIAEHKCKRSSVSTTTDAESGLSSVELAPSEGAWQSIEAPSKQNEQSAMSDLMQSFSFGMRETSAVQSKADSGVQETCTKKKLLSRADRSDSDKKRSIRQEARPSRIPSFRSDAQTVKNDHRQINSLFSFESLPAAEAILSSPSAFPTLETRIPCAPTSESSKAVTGVPSVDTSLEKRRSRSKAAFGSVFASGRSAASFRSLRSLFGKRSSLSPNSDGSRSRVSVELARCVKTTGDKIVNKFKSTSSKSVLPGLSPAAKLVPVRRATSSKSGLESKRNAKNTLHRMPGRKLNGAIGATIACNAHGLRVTRLSYESDMHSMDDANKTKASCKPKRNGSRHIPLLNLTHINTPLRSGLGQSPFQLDAASLSSRYTSPTKRTFSKKHENKHHDSQEATSATKSQAHTNIGHEAVNTGASAVPRRKKESVSSIEDYSDAFGPPTFGTTCGARVDRSAVATHREEGERICDHTVDYQDRLQRKGRLYTVSDSPSVIKTKSSTDSRVITRFGTPSDFEYTGDVVEDCKRLEMLEREFYGITSPVRSDDSDLDMDIVVPMQKKPNGVPLLNMGGGGRSQTTEGRVNVQPNSAVQTSTFAVRERSLKIEMFSDVQSGEADAEVIHLTGSNRSEEAKARNSGNQPLGRQRVPQLHMAETSCRVSTERNSSSLSGFKTPSDFEYTGDVDEDVKNLEKRERMRRGASTVSFSSSEFEDMDSTIGSNYNCQSPAYEQRLVPKLHLDVSTNKQRNTETQQILNRESAETEQSTSQSLGDDVSSFSWMQVSAKETVSESEFSALLHSASKNIDDDDDDSTWAHSDPYDKTKAERYVYSDVALRSVWLEVLLEGMLLEYNTRPSRDHDTHLNPIERIIKYLPKVLMHHLEQQDISKPVIAQLTKKLSLQAPNLQRLLRLLSSSLFPVELYNNRDHIARGAFAHVFRCSLPLEGGPDTCVVKVTDHPAEQNEMANLMDTYSEISIMEQFKTEPHISHLYDYGVSAGNVFLVMKDYKCSLLDWRQRFPEQSPGALRLFLRIFRNIIDAVKILHDKNVVHFDLKCSNILLEPLPGISADHFWNPPTEEPPFNVILADFGEARSYSNNWEARTVRNRGTEYNKSPEMLLIAQAQKTDGPEYDRRKRAGAGPPSDVWALGCLLYELVTGEFLQYDINWFRFFLRVTTNAMSIIDLEKLRRLETGGQTVARELLEFILVRNQLWRPNLTSLSQKIDSLIIADRLEPYSTPRFHNGPPQAPSQIVPKRTALSLLETFRFPKKEVVSFSDCLKIARLECLHNAWILTDNAISLVVLVKGTTQGTTHTLHSTAARANVEILEIALDEDESVSKGHAEIVVSTRHSHRVCFTCEEGFESDTFELILKTLQCLNPSSTEFENLMDIRRSLKTF